MIPVAVREENSAFPFALKFPAGQKLTQYANARARVKNDSLPTIHKSGNARSVATVTQLVLFAAHYRPAHAPKINFHTHAPWLQAKNSAAPCKAFYFIYSC